MKSKVLMLALASAAISLTSKAQSKDAATTFGVRAGVNFQNINGKEADGSSTDYKLKTGFNIGVNAEVPIAPDFYVQPGLLFTTKGAKVKVTGADDAKVNLSYLEIPINLLYKPEIGGGKLLLGVGPYFAFGVGGKLKQGSNDETIKFKNEVTVSEASSAPYFKRFDAGGNLLFGYEMSSKLSFQLNAQLGMVKINPKITGVSSDKTKYHNTGFGISVGYRF